MYKRQFVDGSLQFADTIATDMMATVKDTPEFHKIPTLGTYYCGFNVDVYKRQQLSLAVWQFS